MSRLCVLFVFFPQIVVNDNDSSYGNFCQCDFTSEIIIFPAVMGCSLSKTNLRNRDIGCW